MEDKEKNIWLGTKGTGLFLLTPKSLNQYSITHFKHRSEDPYSISDNSIYSIFQDSRRLLWWRIESVYPRKQRFPHIYPQ